MLQGFAELPHANKLKMKEQPYNYLEQVRPSHCLPVLLFTIHMVH